MTTIVRFRPLLGAQEADGQGNSPLCYFLEVDGMRLLLDCGWNERFDAAQLEPLRQIAPTIDAVLLSHPDLEHLGALPYAYAKLGLKCNIYTTTPVNQMGQLFLYEAYMARSEQEDFELFTLDDIDDAFRNIINVKYSQTIHLPKQSGITITAYAAGHMLGGCVWRITKNEEDIVYAVDYNHKKERHLNGTVLETLSRPFIFITDAYTSMLEPSRRADRDKELLERLTATLRNHGNVLLVVDTAGRLLELLLLLEKLWSDPGLSVYPALVLGTCVSNVVRFAQTLLEYMRKELVEEGHTSNPFDLQQLKLVRTLREVSNAAAPKLVITGHNSLEAGFAHDLFLQWANDPRNLLLFTTKPPPGSLGAQLLEEAPTEAQGRQLQLVRKARVLLEGAELEEYREQQRLEREARDAEALAILAEEDEVLNDLEEPGPAPMEHDLMAERENPNPYFMGGMRSRVNPMYPFLETKRKWDAYGEIIRPEDYVIRRATAAPDNTQSMADKLEDQVEQALTEERPPSKAITWEEELTVNCMIHYIDFEGRSDGQSAQYILRRVRPRNLVVIHGDHSSTEHFAEHAATNADDVNMRMFTPQRGEDVDITAERQIYQIKLRDALVGALEFEEVGDMKLAWVDGVVAMQRAATATSEAQATIELTAAEDPSAGDHQALFVGDLRLPEFRKLLNNKGIEAEFSGGQLVCNGRIAVRKDKDGWVIDGPVCADYYRVRDLLYGQFAMV